MIVAFLDATYNHPRRFFLVAGAVCLFGLLVLGTP